MGNRRLINHVLNCSCGIVHGDRGAGKSTLFALIVEAFKNAGYDVYCQYPYKGCFKIPLKETYINGVKKADVDKEWLYSANLSHACVLIDEARTLWPARGYAKWTISDDEFFNFLRKNDTHLFMATQAYDALDLNCRRAADETYYLTSGIWHFTHIEASHTTLAKVADKQTEVVGRMFKKGMERVTYDICEVPSGYFLFWRKPYYDSFISTHTFYEKPILPKVDWESVIDFNELQQAQGFYDMSYYLNNFKSKIFDLYYKIKSKKIEDDEEDTYDEIIEEDSLFLGQDLDLLDDAVLVPRRRGIFGRRKSVIQISESALLNEETDGD